MTFKGVRTSLTSGMSKAKFYETEAHMWNFLWLITGSESLLTAKTHTATHRSVYLDVNHRQRLFGSAVVSGHSVDGLWNIVQNQIQVHLVFLWQKREKKKTPIRRRFSQFKVRNQKNRSLMMPLFLCSALMKEAIFTPPPHTPVFFLLLFYILTGNPLYLLGEQEAHSRAS